MKIVVSGGTGFIGRKLVARFVEKSAESDRIVVLTRDPARSKSPSAKVSFAAWTPEREGAWVDVVGAADVVVHLAGAGVMDERWSDARKVEIRASRVASTRLIAEAMARGPKERTRVFVSSSAIGIYGTRSDEERLDERAPHGQDFLASVCEAWESSADAARAANVRVVHPRLGIVLGEGEGALAKLAPPFKAFVGGPIGDGRQGFSWVHVRDVVRAIDFALEHETFNGPFNVTAPEPVSMNELATTLGKVLHRPSAMRVPAFALKLALGESAETLLTGPRVVPAKLLAAGFRFDFERLRPALEEIFNR